MSDNWQLGIESSTGHASVALMRGDELVAEASGEAERNQSVVLMEPLREVLAAMPEGERLAAVVIGTGPASYNGARAGIAAGQGVALVSGCPAVGMCSWEGVAAVRIGEPCLAVGDARRDSWFTLALEDGRLSGGVELLAHPGFVARVGAAAGRLLSFEGAERLHLPPEVAARVEVARPEARLILAAWNAKPEEEQEAAIAVPPEPFYLRDPYVTTARTGA